MKITTRYENKEPFEGNRSTQYMGLALFMDMGFFSLTSDNRGGAPRPDPRINLFTRKVQEGLRKRIFSAASELGFRGSEAGIEWEEIVKTGTAKATEYMKAQTPAGSSKDWPLTLTENAGLVAKSFKVAFREAGGIVAEREEFKDSWNVQPSLDLAPPKDRWIYVRKDHPLTDTHKIGVTTRPGYGSKCRDSEYNTHAAESEILVEYRECGILTEKNVQLFYKEKWLKLEFFKLSPEDLEIVTDPKKMTQALISAGFTN